MVDDAPLPAVVAASLRLRLLVLDETLQPLADELHDGVDDALLLEVAVPTPAAPMVAVVATMPVPAMVAMIVTVVMIVAVVAIMAIVVATIAAATAAFAAAFVASGTRPNQPLERFQSFEDLTPIVVAHGKPPGAAYRGRRETCKHVHL